MRFQVTVNSKTEQYEFKKTGSRKYRYGKKVEDRDVYSLFVNGRLVKTYQSKDPVADFNKDLQAIKQRLTNIGGSFVYL